MENSKYKQILSIIDNIENNGLNIIIKEMFLDGDINCLSMEDVGEYINDIKSLYISKYDHDIIMKLFKEFSSLYNDTEKGFILFLSLLRLKNNTNKEKNGFVYLFKSDIGLFKIVGDTPTQLL